MGAAMLLGSTMVAPPAHAATTEMLLSFNEATTSAITHVVDVTGNGNDAVAKSSLGGELTTVAGATGTPAAGFPQPCASSPCPKAVLNVPDAPGLDPGLRDFTWGARVALAPEVTSNGSNLVQKGLYNQPGGQWKLQVDGQPGKPSCVLRGKRADVMHRVTVQSDVSIADGSFHLVECRRTASEVSILVDGVARGSESMTAVYLGNSAPVRIGGQRVSRNSDQFHGTLDDVFVRFD